MRVQHSAGWKWPTVVAQAQGQGCLVRVELRPPEACGPETPGGGILAVGTASVQVRLAEPEQQSRTSSEPDAGSPERPATTSREQSLLDKTRLSADGDPSEFSEYPAMAEVPQEASLASPRVLTRLEVGMLALLGLVCSAILGLLLHGASYAYKYHSKQENPGMRSHDWVWLGQEEGLRLPGLLEEGPLGTAALTHANNASAGRNEALNSPTTKRKRVKFTTFSNTRSTSAYPGLGPVAPVQTSDIKWVCPDMELGDPKDPRRNLEKLHKELN